MATRCERNVLTTVFGLMLLFYGGVAGQVQDGAIRLSDGHNSYSGRVEIYHDGQWGTVCDDYWGINDAEVTCRQLGYQSAVGAYSGAYFGGGTGEIFLDDVQCLGNETRLEDCQNPGWSVHNCGHHEDAGVVCSFNDFEMTTPYWWWNDGDVRLVEGSSSLEGRLEVYHDGKWNTVCDDDWDIVDADVVCRQLGYRGAEEAFRAAYFGAGEGDIILDNLRCSGWESTLLECESNGLYVHNCVHSEDAGVRCERYDFDVTTPYWWWSNGDVRLVEGSSPNEGRVEVYYDGQWNTVCDDYWDNADADVVCRQLGYDGSAEALNNAYFGPGDGDILLDNVACGGWESTLLQCSSNELYDHDCSHGEDAGVRCEHGADDRTVRLSNGYSESSGRVEIYYEGEWGTICDDNWSFNDASVICRQLGYDFVDGYQSNAYFGRGSGPIMYDLGCTGNEWSWEDCSYRNWRTESCSHSEDASVSCAMADFDVTTPYWWWSNGDVRLVEGSSPNEGRVEVYYDGQWNTVCDDYWDNADADVVCRQLGYDGSAEALNNAYFGPGDGDILLDNVACGGWESTLLQCSSNELYDHDCSHGEDAGVRCEHGADDRTVRLSNGYSESSGRVEIYYEGEWGTICDDNWSFNDASVICRQLGYDFVDGYQSNAYFGRGSGPIMYDLGCTGNEWSWEDCSYRNWRTESCSHSEDASVSCAMAENYYYDGSVRLAEGDNSQSGRVEIYYSGQWGTVCDDGWGMEEANVVCKQLGYPSAADYRRNAYFGPGSGQIMLDDVSCDGSEHALIQCDHMGWLNHNCDHNEDAAVICSTPDTYYPRLVDGSTWYEGRVEIWDGNRWETMCEDDFYFEEASTVCRQLGFSELDEILHGTSFGRGNAPSSDVRFDCSSYDNELNSCYVTHVEYSYCGTVGLRCKPETSMNHGVIAAIVIVSVFVVVCISVGLLVTYQHSKKNRGGAQPDIAVISGRTNLSGPRVSQPNPNCSVDPPTYNEVMNNPIIYNFQHVATSPLQRAGTQTCILQTNQGFNTAGQPTSPKPEIIYPYPVQSSPGYAQPPPYPVQPLQSPPVYEGSIQPSLPIAQSPAAPNQEVQSSNTGTDC